MSVNLECVCIAGVGLLQEEVEEGVSRVETKADFAGQAREHLGGSTES